MNQKAVVLLSGGLDSSTALYAAIHAGFQVIALSFSYSQRHGIELQSAEKIASLAGVAEHVVLPLDLSLIGSSALTADLAVPKGGLDLGREDFIPVTYVPARNLIFLSLAGALAEARQAKDIFIGVNALDYSGYPDCRPDFIASFGQTLQLATRAGREEGAFQIHAPLMNLSKAEIVRLAVSLQVPLQYTWSCYDPQDFSGSGQKQPCGKCDSCILRARGFEEAGLADPALQF